MSAATTAARSRLASGEVRDAIDGACMLETIGRAADGPDLVEALSDVVRDEAPRRDHRLGKLLQIVAPVAPWTEMGPS